jgi:hypothetical protein
MNNAVTALAGHAQILAQGTDVQDALDSAIVRYQESVARLREALGLEAPP